MPQRPAPWLFAGLGVGDGSQLGAVRYGIEFDATASSSPPGTAVLATVSPGLDGAAGAKVFAAGTLGFGGSDNPVATVLFQNLWQHLTVP